MNVDATPPCNCLDHIDERGRLAFCGEPSMFRHPALNGGEFWIYLCPQHAKLRQLDEALLRPAFA